MSIEFRRLLGVLTTLACVGFVTACGPDSASLDSHSSTAPIETTAPVEAATPTETAAASTSSPALPVSEGTTAPLGAGATTTTRAVPPPPPTTSRAAQGVWKGTVAVTLDYYAPCGQGFQWVQVGTQSFRHDVEVVADPPLAAESNTFQLSIQTNHQTTEGGFSIVSSGRFNTSSGPLTLAYWDLTVANGKITGKLVNPHIAEGVAQNLLYTNKLLDPCSNRLGAVMLPLAMDVGTVMDGTLGPSSGSLRITGRTTDWLRGYRLDFSLDRAS